MSEKMFWSKSLQSSAIFLSRFPGALAELTFASIAAGEAVSLDAGAYPEGAPRSLYIQAPRHGGELHADGQHSSL